MSDFKDFLKNIGPKWQQKWNEAKIFNADPDPSKPKFFATFPYPYVNASVHLGHGYTELKLDFIARIKRMQGYNVLFPQGFHATGEPIVGMAKRLQEGDPIQQQILTRFGVEKNEIEKFYDPRHIVDFFVNLCTKDMKSIGFSIDWRRQFITTPITPVYSKFIEWQYLTLKKMGFVELGSHPVIWCPNDQSPTGDHDRLVGDGVTIAEYVLLKFPFEDKFFLPATLRPETIYGVTNMFLHPDVIYVTVEVDDEKWIVSKEAVTKLEDQEHEVTIISEHSASEFYGKYCKNPITNSDVILLPATFVSAEWGSGVVMSVPAHAPVDWVAIQNIKEQASQLETKYNIDRQAILDIKPISLITIDGYGEFPAVEVIDQMGIIDQNDERVEEATKEIYKAEFHSGICKAITGKYKGRFVKDIKEELIEDYVKQNIAAILYEPADEVVCRCGTRNHVKILSKQWFLTYGEPKWKKAVHQELEKMQFLPPAARMAFTHTVDWLKAKACARKSGLGTPLPWDSDWIVETLSDSTIYMAYYTISGYVNEGKIKEENAVPELFDYIFRGKGSLKIASQKSKLTSNLIKDLRKEFEYWYPMDLRISGKDLVHNHLTFCIFQHQAIFKPNHRPLAMGVNGHMSVSGQKMSKSRGIFTPLSEAVSDFSADLTRIGLIGAGEGLDDANFNENELNIYERWLDQFRLFYNEEQTRNDEQFIDHWIKSRMQVRIEEATKLGEALQTRSYIQKVLFETINDLRHYKRRSPDLGSGFQYVTQKGLFLLNPVVPHFCEELWSQEHDSFLALEPFPIADSSLRNNKAEKSEEYLTNLLDDIANIQNAMKLKSINKLEITITPQWKEDILVEYLKDSDKLIPRIMKNPDIKKHGKKATQYAQKLLKSHEIIEHPFSRNHEFQIVKESSKFIESTVGAKVAVNFAENSNSPRKELSEPNRPALFIE
ncbi:MAG: leucine--tRNA ligase [Candidatus Hodarchaeota archaeon]